MTINTELKLAGSALTLMRYPAKHQHKSLQAWDSADELLLAHWFEDPQQASSVALFNDEFGALACGLLQRACQLKIISSSDSWISQKATDKNLQRNGIADQVEYYSSLESPPDTDVVFIKVPRSLALLEWQLRQINQHTSEHTRIIAAAKVNALTPSVFKLFEKYFGRVTTSLAKKKSRLLFCHNEKLTTPPLAFPTQFETSAQETGQAFTLLNHANVFSRQNLDIGARIMLKHLPELPANSKQHIVDLGCGNGVLGLALLALNHACQLSFYDESFMALGSAKLNVEKNLPQQLSNCRFIASNCLEGYDIQAFGHADLVICNPPFHQQNTITEHIAWQMFHDAYKVLRTGGELRVVANRHLPYGQTLKKRFGGFSVVASERKFVILSAIKR